MNIDTLKKCADCQHIATVSIAAKLVSLPELAVKSLPVIARDDIEQQLIFVPEKHGATPDLTMVNPYVMNGSFALELRLKLLHALETREQLFGHDLRKLFNELTEESQQTTTKYLTERSKNNHYCTYVSSVLRGFNVPFEWNIEFLLEQSKLSFERWRYIYEEKQDIPWFCGYTQIKTALDWRISQLKKA